MLIYYNNKGDFNVSAKKSNAEKDKRINFWNTSGNSTENYFASL